jgi:hypothetical protein
MRSQSRQSAKLFLQSSELGLPTPRTQAGVPPPPFGSGEGAHSLAREGVIESQIQRGDIHLWYSKYTYFVYEILRYNCLQSCNGAS